ncbi:MULTISPECIES: response regulator [unclassified Methylobacterium]|uniref:response regulator n=1 Tax=unclassified Methylobacterium TaxID=2615210 RepID=UPI00226A4F75|nr:MULTISPECIES: response regulator [unclassified Methylobacterium]
MLRSDARVLIVDGQVAVARLVAKICGSAGLSNTDVAFDTLTARGQIEADTPDVVVIDARAAPMRVTAFITLVRRLTDGRALTFLMTTSRTAEAVEAASEAGVDGVLLKPFTPGDLRAEIAAATGKRQAFPRKRWDQSEQNVVAIS